MRLNVLTLRTTLVNEADLIAFGITEEGKGVSLYARAAKKSQKRFGGGVLEPLHAIEVEAKLKTKSQEDSLYFISEAKLIKGFEGVRSNYAKIELGLQMAQTLAKILAKSDLDAVAYRLFGHTLLQLQALPENPSAESLLDLELHFLVVLLVNMGWFEPNSESEVFARFKMSEHQAGSDLFSAISETRKRSLRDHIQLILKTGVHSDA